MTSRDRVLAALGHREPDMVPLDLGGTESSGLTGVTCNRLEARFGRDIAFWGGGCDTQRVLARGSAQAVRDEVRRRVRDLAPGGGFVFTQVHNVQPDVPPEDVVEMLRAFGDCRARPS